MKTREERREELKRLAATPNGTDKLYAVLTSNFIPFEKLPIGTLMIEAILGHEYSEKRVTWKCPAPKGRTSRHQPADLLRRDTGHVEPTRPSEGFGQETDHDNRYRNDHFSRTGHQCNSPLAEMYPLLWPSLSSMKKS
jgi:hypothetical protein